MTKAHKNGIKISINYFADHSGTGRSFAADEERLRAMNLEYQHLLEYLIQHLPDRMYAPIGEPSWSGFFTKERLSLADAKKHTRQPLPSGLQWGTRWEYGWFFATVELPDDCIGKEVLLEAKQAESTVFVNDRVVGAFDKEHTHISLTPCAVGGERFDIAMEVYAGHFYGDDRFMERDKITLVLPEREGQPESSDRLQRTVRNGTFGIFHREIFHLWMDLQTLYDLYRILPAQSLRHANLESALCRACDALDPEEPLATFLQSCNRIHAALQKELNCKNGSTAPLMYAIGHSHLDLEWLWTDAETRRKIARTVGNQLQLAKEYPEYRYVQSQPWLIEVLKNDYPELYSEFREAVKQGIVTVEGGTWVEPDVNLPSGESLIRQFLYGKRYLREEFDRESEIFWLPDSFGMSASLPQIMKGCGIRYFMNAKIRWQYNGGEEYPHSTFWWRGIDGTEVLTHLTAGYADQLLPSFVKERWELNTEMADVPIGMIMYGHGDGGGGATRIHLEHLRREADLEGMPKLVSASPNAFFQSLERDCTVKHTYEGELYYTAHRGAYTTQAAIKKWNRRSEFALREAEFWSALTGTDDRRAVAPLWKRLLFNQFHDILPGTSIPEVCDTCVREMQQVVNGSGEITDRALRTCMSEDSAALTVFNSLSWDRTVYIPLPKGATSLEGCRTQQIGETVLAEVSVPACGCRSYRLGKAPAAASQSGETLVLENRFLRAEFNADGELIRLTDRVGGTECLQSVSNVFRMYRDMSGKFDAWDIDGIYPNMEVALEKEATVTETYFGPLEQCIVIRKHLHASQMTQRVILREDSRYLLFETEVDWNETHKLLKVDFHTNLHTDTLYSEVQFGAVKRPNHQSMPHDADRFEVCQHKWSAFCEAKRGLALLNDSKYGISANGGTMSLTLLRSTMNPAPYADRGTQTFSYALMPFASSFAESYVVQCGYELNSPVAIQSGYAEEKTWLSVSAPNIVIDTVKCAEDGSGDLIVRMYECVNTATQCTLQPHFAVQEAFLTDLLEENATSVPVDPNGVSLSFRGFEVKTVRLKR